MTYNKIIIPKELFDNKKINTTVNKNKIVINENSPNKIITNTQTNKIRVNKESAQIISKIVQGPPGPQGNRGASILNGTIPPVESLGLFGDFYLDTTTAILYGPKQDSINVWENSLNLINPVPLSDITITYDDCSIIRIEKENGNYINFDYDSNGYIANLLDQDSNITNFIYDLNGYITNIEFT